MGESSRKWERSWDALAAKGAVLLLPPVSVRRRVTLRSASLGVPSIHPFSLRDLAYEGAEEDAFCAALIKLLDCPGERLTGERLELFVAHWCVAASYARAENAGLYSCIRLQKLLTGAASAAYIGDHPLLKSACVNASVIRSKGVQVERLADTLRRAASNPVGSLKTIFHLGAGWAPGRHRAVDVAEFYAMAPVAEALRMENLVLVLYQAKDGGAGAHGSSSVGCAARDWKAIEDYLKKHDLWDQWRDRIVYVLVDRHSGGFQVESSKHAVAFLSGRGPRQSVVFKGTDLGGWVPETVMAFLRLSEFLEQANIDGGVRELSET